MGEYGDTILLVACAVGSLFFFYRRGLRYLQFFQQEDYESGRFARWFMDRQAFDRRGSIVAALAAVMTLLFKDGGEWIVCSVNLAAAAALYFLSQKEEDPRVQGKLKLKMTERARRIFYLGLAVYVLIVFASTTFACSLTDLSLWPLVFWIGQVVCFQIAPLILILANSLLNPYEKGLQEDFANQARTILKRVNPLVIGITGSYGKTSTKVILADILNSVSPTFTTPGSINSYMGMTREIRNRLKAQHKYAVVEMGAYYTGSIKRMCSLTPPAAAIVTAVGQMHLERFGSQENVFKAKSELPQALSADGILVLNGDYEYCRKMAVDAKTKNVFIYGLDQDKGQVDCLMHDISVTDKGTEFSIKWQGKEYRGFTSLLGRMLSNALASFTMACALGLNPELVLAVIRNVKTESNRLEPVRTSIASLMATRNGKEPRPGNVLRLNDAYNSNPQGFAGALEVLHRVNGNRKILVTPGMIELGERQFEENKNAARQAATTCDLVLVVGKTNEKALLAGLADGGLPTEKCKQFVGMKEALTYLAEDYCVDGDVVLIENDLPDLYESAPVF